MNDDLISREALKEVLTNETRDKFVFVCLSWVFEKIDKAPTVLHDNYSEGYQDGVRKVLSERPTGHWIKTNREYKLKDKDNTFVGVYHKCSECGFDEARGGKFCLNCGADMRGDNNGN